MGSSLFVTANLFIRIKDGKKKIDRITSINSCPKQECKQHGKRLVAKFCSDCGTQVQTINIVEKREASIRDIVEIEDMDTFYVPEYLSDGDDKILVYNYTPYKNKKDFENGSVITLNELENLKELCFYDFDNRKEAKEFFDSVEQHFGTEKVTLEFGVITFWS